MRRERIVTVVKAYPSVVEQELYELFGDEADEPHLVETVANSA